MLRETLLRPILSEIEEEKDAAKEKKTDLVLLRWPLARIKSLLNDELLLAVLQWAQVSSAAHTIAVYASLKLYLSVFGFCWGGGGGRGG